MRSSTNAYEAHGRNADPRPNACSYTGAGARFFYGPDRLDDMMRTSQSTAYTGNCAWGQPSPEDRSGCRYNEIVFNGGQWTERLPSLVEALFYPINGHVDTWEGDAGRARMLQQQFLHTYGIDADQVPLLTFDIQKARGGEAPFQSA